MRYHSRPVQNQTLKPLVVSFLTGLVTFLTYYHLLGGGDSTKQLAGPGQPGVEIDGSDGDIPAISPQTVDGDQSPSEEEEKLERMREKLQPKHLEDADGKVLEHQFLHLHHMKTGGTCM